MEAVKNATEGVKNLVVSDKSQNQKPKKEKKKSANTTDGRPLELSPPAPFIDHRLKIFEDRKQKYDAEIAAKPRENINITLGDGKVIVGQSWETSPATIAKDISKSLFERTVIARVDGEQLWDLERPLEASCRLELLDFEHPEAQRVYWHTSAHCLGQASERRYGCNLAVGPPIDDGFYYEMALPDMEAVSEADLKPLETIVNTIIKQKQQFERLILSKEDLLLMFQSNKYKQHIIKDKIPDGTSTTVYRNGPFIDLCRGPHLPHTGRIKAFWLNKNSASYFLGDPSNDSLQRIYGISFPDKKQLEEHKELLRQAALRDHRKIGKEQELFFFHELSPGSCFFLPHGKRIYNNLMHFIESEYWSRGYQDVGSPNMYNADLWKQSGHWQHYQDDMFTFEVEKQQWALKPMNCPGHCLIFAHRDRSWRDLPFRVAEFGVLHRNEASGALTGLTRVRRFQQDDSHIFCTEDQIGSEITNLFDFLATVYGKFGFTFKMKLSTRPEKFLGSIETWDLAEAKLQKALEEFSAKGGAKWELNPGDGAFYGPKIDITISDALKRDHQCATIQLDFQLPIRFNLEYRENAPDAPAASAAKGKAASEAPATGSGDTENKEKEKEKEQAKNDPSVPKPLPPGSARPVIIHRAIYGSFERFIAILTEHFAGKWPFWLSPRQILVVPVMPAVNEYVHEVVQLFKQKGFHADADVSGNTMQWKIRTGQLVAYNYIFVVGAQERESRTVNIRNRDDPTTQAKGELVPLDKALEQLVLLRDERRLENRISTA